jgi:hypothetical protein
MINPKFLHPDYEKNIQALLDTGCRHFTPEEYSMYNFPIGAELFLFDTKTHNVVSVSQVTGLVTVHGLGKFLK